MKMPTIAYNSRAVNLCWQVFVIFRQKKTPETCIRGSYFYEFFVLHVDTINFLKKKE